MDKNDLFTRINELTTNVEDILLQLQNAETVISEILEENTELKIENQNLRERLTETNKSLEHMSSEKDTQHGLSKSRKNLEKLYESGYHICNEWYGKHRADDESCAFCLAVIYGDR